MKVFTYFLSISLLAFQSTMACTLDIDDVPSKSPGTSSELKILNLKEFIISIGYPQDLKAKGIEGKVLFKLEVSAHGKLINHMVIESTSEEFSVVCSSKLDKLKFQPAVNEQGKRIDSSIILPVRFELTF